MSNSQGFQPDWASPPGDTINDILLERGMSLDVFAQRLGQTIEGVHDLLEGRTTITIATARRLEQVLGGSVEFWVSRDFQYREDMQKIHVAGRKWVSQLPVGDMIRFGWISPPDPTSDELTPFLRFFGVRSVRAWYAAYAGLEELVAFRTSPSFESHRGAVIAWLRKGEAEAEAIDCGPWNPRKFQEALSDIRSLTRQKEPSRFVPELQRRCAEAGVAVAVVRAPEGCRASGATRFLSRDRAVLQLSFRYLTNDQFWFSFFHEAGHLILHGPDRLFLEGGEAVSTAEEEEANNFAARLLIPSEFWEAMLRLPVRAREVIRFAIRVGVAPGVVVGQLQHLGKLKPNQLNTLKRRFRWAE